MLQPGHIDHTRRQGGTTRNTQLLRSLDILRAGFHKTTNSAVDSIRSFELYQVRRNRNDDLVRVRNATWHIFVVLAQKNGITVTKNNQRGYAQLLKTFRPSPHGHYALQHGLKCTL